MYSSYHAIFLLNSGGSLKHSSSAAPAPLSHSTTHYGPTSQRVCPILISNVVLHCRLASNFIVNSNNKPLLQMVQTAVVACHCLSRLAERGLVLCTLTSLAFNLCYKTNPMCPCFNIWSFCKNPCWDPSVVARSARRRPQNCTAFVLVQSPYMMLCWLIGSLFSLWSWFPLLVTRKIPTLSFHYIVGRQTDAELRPYQ